LVGREILHDASHEQINNRHHKTLEGSYTF